jgi:hypothetical protein
LAVLGFEFRTYVLASQVVYCLNHASSPKPYLGGEKKAPDSE